MRKDGSTEQSSVPVMYDNCSCFVLNSPTCHTDANVIKSGSNLIMTDKHAAEYSKSVCYGTS